MWDVSTGEHREIATGNAYPGGFSADGKLVAISMPDGGDQGVTGSIKIFSVPQLAETCTISILLERANGHAATFALDGKVLIGTVTWHPRKNDWRTYESQLAFWDTQSGQELFSMAPPTKGEQFVYVKGSPDGKHVVVTTYDHKRSRGRVLLIDVANQSSRTVSVADAMPREPVFHPDGRWLVVPIQGMPGSFVGREPAVEELPQPRLECIDVASGEILETALAPQSYLTSMAFSPDGKTLATSGDGEVLLWDFRTPPGQSEAVAAQ